MMRRRWLIFAVVVLAIDLTLALFVTYRLVDTVLTHVGG